MQGTMFGWIHVRWRFPRGDMFAVYDQSDRRLGASPHPPEFLRGQVGDHGPQFRTQRWAGRSYRVLRRPNLRIIDRAESGGVGLERPVTIVYAAPLDHIWWEVFEGIGFYLAASLLLTVGTTIFMVGLMRRVLQPIEELASAAAAVSPPDLLFQAPAHALRTRELRPLALALTTMVDELRVAFDRQHRFLGDATHELKTAVSVVRSSLQLMLLRRRSAEAYEDGLRAAVEDNARAEDLITRMLLMARLEESPGAPSPGAPSGHADLLSVVCACIQTLWPLAEQAGLRLEQSDRPGNIPPIRGAPEGVVQEPSGELLLVPLSPSDLEVVVSNLVVNAIEHSAPGSAIVVETTRCERDAVLRVTDRGEGIPEDLQEHIFERFFRADPSRARGTGGAGLGLSITKAIVDGAGGSIAVASRVGEGTTITVRLPCAWPPESAAAAVLAKAERKVSDAV